MKTLKLLSTELLVFSLKKKAKLALFFFLSFFSNAQVEKKIMPTDLDETKAPSPKRVKLSDTIKRNQEARKARENDEQERKERMLLDTIRPCFAGCLRELEKRIESDSYDSLVGTITGLTMEGGTWLADNISWINSRHRLSTVVKGFHDYVKEESNVDISDLYFNSMIIDVVNDDSLGRYGNLKLSYEVRM